MRLRRRMAAAVLAVVMTATSIQGPGGVSYAAELGSGSMESGQEALEPAAKAPLEEGSGSADEKDVVSDGGERQENSAASEGEAQPDESAEATGDNQAGEETGTADTEETSKTEETVTEEGETVATDETVTEETGTEEAATEETETDETESEEAAAEENVIEEEAEDGEEVIEAEPDCVYQLGGAPSDADEITVLADGDAADYLYKQMLKRTETISMNGYNIAVKELVALVSAVVNEHPDLYFYEGSKISSSGSNITITVTYTTGYDDDAFRTKTADALSCVSDGMSDFVKAAALHDYLAVNVEYDYENYLNKNIPKVSYNAYGALVNGTAVCNGYALAYKYLLSKVGIESYMVTSDTMNHAWNMVKLDGKYYHVDVTHDDPAWDMAGRVCHTNLFRSDANFGEHEGWEVTSGSSTVDYKATDTTYESAFWVDSTAPLVFDGNDCYYISYISDSGSLRKASFSNITNAGTEIVNLGKWTTNTGGWWQDAYSGLYQIGGRLFYNDAKSIYSIRKDGTEKTAVFTPTNAGSKSIYYSAYRGGEVVYALHDDPLLSAKQEVLTAKIEEQPAVYYIRYELDGGVNDSGNPDSYNRGTETITLEDATKEGFKFGGWYEDAGLTKKVETISAGSEGDITLYAKWMAKDALGLANLEKSFLTLDGRRGSSKADGKPKVLIFFKPDCWYCQQTNVQLSANIRAFAGADIYAVEIAQNTMAAVSKFKTDYGCDEITYCYDEGQGNNSAMWSYMQAAGIGGTQVATPVVAYIDAENRLQKVTTGQATWSVVLQTLRDYCGYDYYLIDYELRGGTNNSENPESYRSRVGAVLKDPVKDGETFEGWYTDAASTKKVTGISKGTKGNITLYAKWGSSGGSGLGIDNLDFTFAGLNGKKLSSKAEGKPKLLVFFYETTASCQNTIQNISKDIDRYAGVDVYTIDMTQYDTTSDMKSNLQKFKEAYGCNEIMFAYDNWLSDTPNSEKSEAYRKAAELSGSYIPLICYIDKDNKLQWVSSLGKEQTSDAVLENLEKYCNYRPAGVYQIIYELDGGVNNSDNPSSYKSGSETIKLKAPTKEGYTFFGWYEDAGFTKKVEEISKGREGDITLYAKWEEAGLGLPNLDYTFTTLDDQKVSSKADGKPKILYFFKPDCGNFISESQELREHIRVFAGVDIYAVEMTRTAKDDVSAFKEEYGCDEITYCYDTTAVSLNAMYGYYHAVGNTGTRVETPVVAYIDAENRLQKVTTGYKGWSVVLKTLQECCGYDYYIIDYVLDGGTNNSENPELYRSSVGAALKDPVKDGLVFAGWYADAAFKERVTGISKGTKGNITLYAKWEMDAESGLGIDNLDYTFTGIDKKKLSSKAEGKPKLLVFFMHDSDSGKETMQNITGVIDSLSEVDVYAIDMTQSSSLSDQAKDTREYKQNYGCDEIKFAYADMYSPLNYDKAKAYQEAAGLKEMYMPLICYIDKDNKLQWVSEREQTGDAVLKNLQKYCNYQPAGVYQITYELDGGTNHKDNPASYTSKTATIVLKDAEKQGCVFDGWYKDAGFKEKITEIPQGSTGDITLYAKWREGLDLANPKQTYIGMDSKTLSSTADGKPKLLVFFEAAGKESQNTVKSITAMIDSLDGVDIYAIESGNALFTDVQAFKNTYGCSGIKFAYQNTYDYTPNATKALEYVKKAGLPESMNYPIICYIDKDNKLQWVTEKEQTGDAVLENLKKYCEFSSQGGSQGGLEAEITITFVDDSTFVYNGKEQKPKVKVTTTGQNGNAITLKEKTDYTLSYKDNKNAGMAKVIVTGMGEYKGTVEETFTIEPAPLIIRAVDKVILVGDKIPAEYGYEMDGLLAPDELSKEPTLTCDIVSTAKEGEYTVTPTGADAGSNYIITYEDGKLIVTTEYLLWKVTFDTQGHGEAPAVLSGIRSGDTIDSPVEPKAEGYRFDGWYRDSECKKAWNFETDIVETDITLYAKWLCVSSDGSFALQEVPDQYYTGKALKPAVSVYDGDTLLKAGKDYQVKYFNNINANNIRKTGNGEGVYFDKNLPYVEITGKGNYKSTVKVNFNILKVSIGDSSLNPAAGAVLKVNDHFAKSNKAVKPSVSLKIGKALKKDTDFTLEIYTYDASGYLRLLAKPEIPAGATGEFMLLINGAGNYEGSIMKYIYVADKDHLMKNAKITLGKNLKNINYEDYTGDSSSLKPSDKDGDDVFTVRIGKQILNPRTDYYVEYPNGRSAGKLELVVVGKGDYFGRQTTTFNVKGMAFSNSTVSIDGITDRTYTGKAHTQNKEAVVTYKGASKPLVYGSDYTISYSKNINKGTATMTFTGNPGAGYSGKVKKTFKIDAADIKTVKQDPSMKSITVSYSKAGAKPVEEIMLTNEADVRLRGGKDYTLKYKDNKAVTAKATVTVTGKGNYTGKFDVPFRIVEADLGADHIVKQSAAAAYSENKAADFAYKPAVKVMDGKTALKAGVDYEIEYVKNTQSDYEIYLNKLKAGGVKEEDVPRARITAKDDSNYGVGNGKKSIDVPLQIYQTKFTKNDLKVQIIGETVYTGGQVTPDVTVSYKGKTLRKGVHFRLTYGANDKAGKNKGSVTVNGLAPYYGGSVTYKFEIIGKDLNF